jgi:hypothetical protein
MDEETKKALEGSIAKWERIVAGTGYNMGAANCPLCQIFNHHCDDDGSHYCDDRCPVKIKTGRNFCEGSPYDEYEGGLFGTKEEETEVAQRMLDFLIGLRPTQ